MPASDSRKKGILEFPVEPRALRRSDRVGMLAADGFDAFDGLSLGFVVGDDSVRVVAR